MYYLTDGLKYLSELHGNLKDGYEYIMTIIQKEAMGFGTFQAANEFRLKHRLDSVYMCIVKTK